MAAELPGLKFGSPGNYDAMALARDDCVAVSHQAFAFMTAQIAARTPSVKGHNHTASFRSPSIAALSQVRGRVLRSARALTTMAASNYKYVVLGGGNASG